MVKNPNWREADQLAIYKHDQGVELGSTKKQLQLSGQNPRSLDFKCSALTTQPYNKNKTDTDNVMNSL